MSKTVLRVALQTTVMMTMLGFSGMALAAPGAPQDAEDKMSQEAPPPESEIPAPTIDTNGDGKPDAWDRDANGVPDAWDVDGDGKPDLLDNDGDGRPDGEKAPPPPEEPGEPEPEPELGSDR